MSYHSKVPCFPTSLTEVSQFELSDVRDEQVLRLDVPVQDAAGVAVAESPQQLVHEQLHVLGVKAARMAVQVLSQVRVLTGRGKVRVASFGAKW